MAKQIESFHCQLRTQSIALFRKYTRYDGNKGVGLANFRRDGAKKVYSGTVTTHAKRRIRKAVQVLNQISDWQQIYNPITMQQFNFRLTFITLTMPNSTCILSGKEAYQLLLKPFLQTMIRVYGMRDYIWKAELQKNGQIHYHITTNVFIRYDLIRRRWNTLLDKAGVLDAYKAKHGHSNPNSTDVHRVLNDDDIEGYMEKYISKACENSDSVGGKVWDCSMNLKQARLFEVEVTPDNVHNIVQCKEQLSKDEYINDYYEIHFFKTNIIRKVLHGWQHQLYDEWKQSVINRQPPPTRHMELKVKRNKQKTKKKGINATQTKLF